MRCTCNSCGYNFALDVPVFIFINSHAGATTCHLSYRYLRREFPGEREAGKVSAVHELHCTFMNYCTNVGCVTYFPGEKVSLEQRFAGQHGWRHRKVQTWFALDTLLISFARRSCRSLLPCMQVMQTMMPSDRNSNQVSRKANLTRRVNGKGLLTTQLGSACRLTGDQDQRPPMTRVIM